MLVPLIQNLQQASVAGPTILASPMPQSVLAGTTASFLVVASGSSLTYQWTRNGAPIGGATAAFYTTPVTSIVDNAAAFACVVTNPGGTVTSGAATLTVVSPIASITTVSVSSQNNPGQVDICNIALSRLGVSQPIAALTDNSAQADAVNRVWAFCLQEVLYEGYWRWAAKSAALALVVDQSTLSTSQLIYPGWRYAYRKPADAVKMQAVTTSAGLRTIPYLAYWWERTYPIMGPYRPTWQEIEAPDASGSLILTDQDSAWGVYIANITNTALMDPMFKSALAWKIAIEASGPLKAAKSIVEACMAGYRDALVNALAHNLNEQQPDTYPESPSITVRG